VTKEAKKIGLAVLVIVLSGLLVYSYDNGAFEEPDVTGATVAGQTKCLKPRAALKFIQNKGCTRIYEDIKCFEAGKIEVQC